VSAAVAVIAPQMIRSQIEAGQEGRKRRTLEREMQRIFQVYRTEGQVGPERIPLQNLQSALRHFHAHLSRPEAEHYLSLRGNMVEGLELEEFQQAVNAPSATETWVRSLPLTQLLTDALPEDEHFHRIRAVSSLTDAEIGAVVGEFARSVEELLRNHVRQLRTAFNVMDAQPQSLASKFVAESASEMDGGDVEAYHLGLENRIGMIV
jgi:hypothetical protein